MLSIHYLVQYSLPSYENVNVNFHFKDEKLEAHL